MLQRAHVRTLLLLRARAQLRVRIGALLAYRVHKIVLIPAHGMHRSTPMDRIRSRILVVPAVSLNELHALAESDHGLGRKPNGLEHCTDALPASNPSATASANHTHAYTDDRKTRLWLLITVPVKRGNPADECVMRLRAGAPHHVHHPVNQEGVAHFKVET